MGEKQTRLTRILLQRPSWKPSPRRRSSPAPPPCRPNGSLKKRPGRAPQQSTGPAETHGPAQFTDPESRIIKGRDGFIQAYNAQAGVDADAQIIVAHRLFNNSSDQDALLPLLDAVEANAGEMPNAITADNGFCSEATLQGLIDRPVRGYVAAGRASTPNGGKRGGPLVQAIRTRLRQRGHQSRYRSANKPSNQSSATSNRPEASDNPFSAASTRFAASGHSSKPSTNSQN